MPGACSDCGNAGDGARATLAGSPLASWWWRGERRGVVWKFCAACGESEELQVCQWPRRHGGTRLLDAGNHTGIGLVRLLGGRFIAPSCFIRGGPTRGGERLCVLAAPQYV